MRPQDDTDEVRFYGVGPGRRRRTADPVVEAYADGPIDRHCTNCGAQPLEFCHHPDGPLRKIPCPQRLSEKVPDDH